MSLRSRAVDALFGGLELLAGLYDFVRQMRLPGRQPEPIPLTQRAVAHQQGQIRSATRRDAIRPPPSPGRD